VSREPLEGQVCRDIVPPEQNSNRHSATMAKCRNYRNRRERQHRSRV